jgi:hypothetical protein
VQMRNDAIVSDSLFKIWILITDSNSSLSIWLCRLIHWFWK